MSGATGNGAFGVKNLNSNSNVLVEDFAQKDLEIGEIVDNEDTRFFRYRPSQDRSAESFK
jgi:hypothetical protein